MDSAISKKKNNGFRNITQIQIIIFNHTLILVHNNKSLTQGISNGSYKSFGNSLHLFSIEIQILCHKLCIRDEEGISLLVHVRVSKSSNY